MTVKQLIKRLQEMPQQKQVTVLLLDVQDRALIKSVDFVPEVGEAVIFLKEQSE